MSSHEPVEVNLSPAVCTDVNSHTESPGALRKWIDECDLSGDLKTVLKSVIKTTASAGRAVIRIGEWVVTTIKKICEEFPCASMGVLVGFLIGVMISTAPVIGAVLGAVLTPFVFTATALLGFASDLYVRTVKDALESRIPRGMMV